MCAWAMQMYQERRDLYVGQYMIHSDFAVQGPDGNVGPPPPPPP
jgi:hypothetical protein